MDRNCFQNGRAELRDARKESRGLYWFVAVFSSLVNLLMLTGPLYMLLVYDRVLTSRSVETLVALTGLIAFLYGIMALLDYARGRIMGRAAARFQSRLDRRVFDAALRKAAMDPQQTTSRRLSDLEAVQRLMSSPVLAAMMDIPWTPLFLAGIWVFHPWLGALALSGGALLVVVAITHQIVTKRSILSANQTSGAAQIIGHWIQRDAEFVQSMGMQTALFERWQNIRGRSLKAHIKSLDLTSIFTMFSKSFRMFLQSAMLGLGAYLVILGEISPGVMIAGSILLGRAFSPIDQVISHWGVVQRAVEGWRNLAQLLGEVPEQKPPMPLPRPKADLKVEALTVFAPGKRTPVLKNVSFSAQPGQAIGVIGVTGAGKSTLARALTGAWSTAGGSIRLDGVAIEQFAPEVLGQHIGYLPQRVTMFDGTIAENIAKMAKDPDAEQIVAAAKKAGAHKMILNLPDGYNTKVSATGGSLSGGQLQRIGLARALYGSPAVIILDEPNSNLDGEGSAAVNAAIRVSKKEGKAVLIMAHRPAAIQECDLLLMLEHGATRAFGPKEDVLRATVINHEQVVQAQTKASLS